MCFNECFGWIIKMLQVTNRVLMHCCCTREKRVLLQAMYPDDGPLSLLWSAENICKGIHIFHFPFLLVFVYGKEFYLICTAGIVTPVWILLCVRGLMTKRLNLFLSRVTASCNCYHMVQSTELKNLIPIKKGADSELNITVPAIK